MLQRLGSARLLSAERVSRPSRAICFATIATARSATSPRRPAWPAEYGPALGISTADFNGDGWIDLYVANDGAPNQLWINQRNGTFTNTALLAGAAVSAEGRLKASMGVDAGDFDEDGDEDVFVGELTGQGADLYVNDGSGVFVEDSAQAGIRLRTLPFTAFGAAWLDADNDGLAGPGDRERRGDAHRRSAGGASERFALQQHRQLFRNLGKGRFEEVTDRAGRAFSTRGRRPRRGVR